MDPIDDYPKANRTKRYTRIPPPADAGKLRRKLKQEWVREQAAGLVRISGAGIQHIKQNRDNQVKAAVETAVAIWEQVEERLAEKPDVPSGEDET